MRTRIVVVDTAKLGEKETTPHPDAPEARQQGSPVENRII